MENDPCRKGEIIMGLLWSIGSLARSNYAEHLHRDGLSARRQPGLGAWKNPEMHRTISTVDLHCLILKITISFTPKHRSIYSNELLSRTIITMKFTSIIALALPAVALAQVPIIPYNQNLALIGV